MVVNKHRGTKQILIELIVFSAKVMSANYGVEFDGKFLCYQSECVANRASIKSLQNFTNVYHIFVVYSSFIKIVLGLIIDC